MFVSGVTFADKQAAKELGAVVVEATAFESSLRKPYATEVYTDEETIANYYSRISVPVFELSIGKCKEDFGKAEEVEKPRRGRPPKQQV